MWAGRCSAQQPGKQDQLPGTHGVPDTQERPQTARVLAEGSDPAPRWHLAKSGALFQETDGKDGGERAGGERDGGERGGRERSGGRW